MSTGPTIFEVGTTIGDYQIISVIGRGGMGKLFKVRNLLSDRIEAMKVLLPGTDLRTDDMECRIRPLDHKHPRLLPIGQEGEFKISKDVIEMRIPDGDHKKRRYQVVAMKPIDHSDTNEIGGNRMKYDKGQTVTNDKPLAQKVPQTKPY